MHENIDVKEIFKEPVKRSELATVLNCKSDRQARKLLADLREDYNIINLQDGRGYVLADDETALRYAMQERKRAISAFKTANRIIMRCSKGTEGITVPVKSHFRTINKVYVNKNQLSFEEME
jgi:hypothetical protein